MVPVRISLSISPSKCCMPSFPPTRMASSSVLPSASPLLTLFASAQRGFQNFDGGYAPAAIFTWNQPLRNHITKTLGHAVADDHLLERRKHSNNSLYRLRRVDGMQGRHT